MNPSAPAVELFFLSFERNNACDDLSTILAQFADPFMAAGPQGTQAVRAGDFALALPKRKQFFAGLGHRSTALVSLEQTPLDARYVLAKTRWRMTFIRNQDQPQELLVDSTYILDTGSEAARIVFYLAHKDIMVLLKDKGLLPA